MIKNRFYTTCKICGKEYLTTPYRMKKGSKYCSQTCMGKDRIIPIATRFWNKVEKTETCWNWTGVYSYE